MDWLRILDFIQQSGLESEAILSSAVLLIIVIYFLKPDHAFGIGIWVSLFSLILAFFYAGFCPKEGEYGPFRFFPQIVFLKRFFIVSGSVALFSYLEWLNGRKIKTRPETLILLILSLFGLNILISAASFWLVFLAAELITFCSFGLLKPESTSKESIQSILKYFGVSAFSTAIGLFGFSLLVGFEFGQIESNLISHPYFDGLKMAGALLFVSFLIFKLGGFPFHFWVPSLFEHAPTPWVGYISTAPKVAGAFALLFVHKTLSADLNLYLSLLCIAGAWIAHLSALHAEKLKRMLAFSSIGQATMLMVPIVFSQQLPNTENQLLIFAVSYGLANQGFFSAIQYIENNRKENPSVADLAGFFEQHALPSLALIILVLSVIGLPPTVGFSAKLILFSTIVPASEGWPYLIHAGLYVTMFASTLLALAYFIRVPYWTIFKTQSVEDHRQRNSAFSLLWLLISSLFTILTFFSFSTFFPVQP